MAMGVNPVGCWPERISMFAAVHRHRHRSGIFCDVVSASPFVRLDSPTASRAGEFIRHARAISLHAG